MPRSQVYCCICGGPFFEPLRDDEAQEWLTRAVLLTTGHDDPDGGGMKVDVYRGHAWSAIRGFSVPHLHSVYPKHYVLHFPAEYEDARGFPVLPTGELAKAMEINTSDDDPLYFPLHQQCFNMVHRYIDSDRPASQDAAEPQSDGGISSVRRLWDVMFSRMRGSECEYILPEPHDYHGGRHCRNVYWEPGDDYEGYGELLEASPMVISGLTEGILQNLQPQGETSETPGETSITGDEAPHEQDWWCEALANKKQLPWLWDLDNETVRGKQRKGKWDWELLVRKLSNPEICALSDSTLNLPLGLRNRRRIWRCIEEARVGDRKLPEFDLMGNRNNWGELQDIPFGD